MINGQSTALKPLRVVTFNVFPPAFDVVNQWATNGGHELALVVTTPGPTTRRNTSYHEIINRIQPGTDVLVTTRLRKVALPLIKALKPDLIVSFTFPYRLPPEITELGRYGAVNLHPTALPAYRGPNPLRAVYEGYPLLGATMHWTAAEFDTGNILSMHTAPLPNNISSKSILECWLPLIRGAFAEGIARAVTGEPGISQNDDQSNYAARFTEEERWVTASETRKSFQCKCAAINFFRPSAKILLGEKKYIITDIVHVDDTVISPPGTITEHTNEGFVLQLLDGRAQLNASILEE
jgi:methionyl-tRNA formyltransferase